MEERHTELIISERNTSGLLCVLITEHASEALLWQDIDHSSFMQEAKAVNGRLVAYLKKPDNLRKLVLYVIGQPPTKPGEAERESDVRTRHSLAACEALCNLTEELPELLASNESLLRTLFTATGTLHSCPRAGQRCVYTVSTAGCRQQTCCCGCGVLSLMLGSEQSQWREGLIKPCGWQQMACA